MSHKSAMIGVSSPTSIFEHDIVVPWEADLPISYRISRKDEDGKKVPYAVDGHSFVLRLYEEPFTDEVPPVILSFTNSGWERTESSSGSGNDTIKRIITWEQLDDLQARRPYFFILSGTNLDDNRYIVAKGQFFKGEV